MLSRSTALFVGAEGPALEVTRDAIGSVPGLSLEAVPGVDDAADRLHEGGIGLVLVHVADDPAHGAAYAVLDAIKGTGRRVPAVALAEWPHPEHAAALRRAGLGDYLAQPFESEELSRVAGGLVGRSTSGPTTAELVECLGGSDAFVYDPNAPMGRLVEQVRRVAPSDVTILLGGDTGTGKSRLARLIHDLSHRRDEPFLVINCGALSSNLIESELFGHVRGAFTGADRDRTGKFVEVGRGTLLLDEIDALPADTQARLLRAVEERVVEPVGSNRSQEVRARLIAASNRSLEAEVAAGRFRADLYFRLNVVTFYLPPLRERTSAIPRMARSFIDEFAARSGRDVRGIAPSALAALVRHDWPGNIRELRNAIERAVVLCPGPEIQLEDLPPTFSAPPAVRSDAAAHAHAHGHGRRDPNPVVADDSSSLAKAREEIELMRIREALGRARNNRTLAAVELGISRMTLYKKMQKYNLVS
jgi:DNA-binding NtrC family response regulator